LRPLFIHHVSTHTTRGQGGVSGNAIRMT
jgi:hypothetical protein